MKSESRKVRRAYGNALENPTAEELFLHHCRDWNGCMNSLSTAAVLHVMPRTALWAGTSLPGLHFHSLPWKGCPVYIYMFIEECVCGLVVLN